MRADSRSLLTAVIAWTLLGCASSDGGPTGPTPAKLTLHTITNGVDPDADGYLVSVDGASPHVVPATGFTVLSGITNGSHQVVFSGLANNCATSDSLSRTLSFSTGANVWDSLTVTCTSRLRVIASTTGADQDVAYLGSVNGGAMHLILANGPAGPVPGTSIGSNQLTISGVASNCTVAGGAEATVVVPNDTLTIGISVSCTAATPAMRRILFGSGRDGGDDLYVMDADGSNVVRLTDDTHRGLYGRWSPDGKKIVYRAPVGASGLDIWVMNADGSNPHALTSDGASSNAINTYPDWSPDGTQILFIKGNGLGSIFIMNADGTGQHLWAPGNWARWSPDATQILWVDTAGIHASNADGTNAYVVQAGGASGSWSGYPAWSPDGSKIAFLSDRDGTFADIYVMNADGTGVVRLTTSPQPYYANEQVDWSPDQELMAFRSTRDGGNPEIYRMKSDGANQTNISSNAAEEFAPAWFP